MEFTVVVPNHGGDPLGSIVGPMGSHWVQKMGQNRKKLPCPGIRIFDYPGHRFFPKNGSYGYGAKSRWGPPRVHLGASGVPLGKKKMGQNRKKLPCPKIRIFEYPEVIDFSQKMEFTVVVPNHGGDPLGSILGPMGPHWVQKMCQNRKKLPCPKIRIFDYPLVIVFLQTMEVTVMAPNHGGDPLESILGPMGSHWIKKYVKTVKITMPQIRIFDYPAVIGFSHKMEFTVMVPNHSGDALGSILGPMGPHWVQKMCQNRKKLPCSKIRIFYYLGVIEFLQKVEVTVMAPNHGGDTIESILGPIGSHWVQKMGQNSKNLSCPKIRIFDYPAVIDFSHKMEVTVMAPNHGGERLGSILDPMGSHWVKKMGQNRQKLLCPKIRIFDYPAVIDFSQNWKLRLWHQITVDIP